MLTTLCGTIPKTNLRVLFAALIFLFTQTAFSNCFESAENITAILGGSADFNCSAEPSERWRQTYGFKWKREDLRTFYFWHQTYESHTSEDYENRVSTMPKNSPYGAASMHLEHIRESDQGWYQCQVIYSDNLRQWEKVENGTWFYLHVRGIPLFKTTPPKVIYVDWGDTINLTCEAEGIPTPKIQWFQYGHLIEPSAIAEISNEGTQLRFPSFQYENAGTYTCSAQNKEGHISSTTTLVPASGSKVIITPGNQTLLVGDKAQFRCQAKGVPANATTEWFVQGIRLVDLGYLTWKVVLEPTGLLELNPVDEYDTGQYMCKVKGIGKPPSASVYLDVVYPARVVSSPNVQNITFGSKGIVNCYVDTIPPLEYVTWTKNKRLLELGQNKDITLLSNGSLLFSQVNEDHHGEYTCTPYNAYGTEGSSNPMQIVVRKPPNFAIEPKAIYQRKIGETVDMRCASQEGENAQVTWKRTDGTSLQNSTHFRISGGSLNITDLENSDFGLYECILSNEIGKNVTMTQLLIEGTQPYAPHNLTANISSFAVTLSWLPGYNGQPDSKQDYVVSYRIANLPKWLTIPVAHSRSTQVTINNLSPSIVYEFQVGGKNMPMSDVIRLQTLDVKLDGGNQPDMSDEPVFKPDSSLNLTVTEVENGFLISWQPPAERTNLIHHYTIKYRTNSVYKTLNKGTLGPEKTSYLVKNLVGGRTYYFQVLIYFDNSYGASEELKFVVPMRTTRINQEGIPLAQFAENLRGKINECDYSSSSFPTSKIYLVAFAFLTYFISI